MASITISLPDTLKQFVDDQLTDKGFGNVSEYVGSLLRDAQARDEDAKLEKLLLEGLESDRLPLDDAFKSRLAEKTAQIIDRRDDRSGA